MRFIWVFTFLLLMAGCANSPTAEKTVDSVLANMALVQAGEVNSVPNFRIDGWEDIDSKNLILTSGRTNRYLVTLMQPCHELRTASGIALDSRTTTLQRLDNIVVRGDVQRRKKCSIDRIIELEPLEK